MATNEYLDYWRVQVWQNCDSKNSPSLTVTVVGPCVLSAYPYHA
jgi:hypothetical protein